MGKGNVSLCMVALLATLSSVAWVAPDQGSQFAPGGFPDCNTNGIDDGTELLPSPFNYSATPNLPITSVVPPGPAISTIVVGDSGTIFDVDVGLNIRHTFDGDCDITLAHNGVTLDISSDNGGSGDNYTNTIFDDEAATAVTAGVAPFTGSFRPEQALTAFDGMNKNGNWTLQVVDDAGGDTGTLLSWSLTIMNPTSNDCNTNNIPDECDAVGNDCNTNGIPDECEAGGAGDCNMNGIADACDLEGNDCNEDGIVDSCNIAAGSSDDCDANGVPDECEFIDCNANGILDVCDVIGGAPDCNTNGSPDECDVGESAVSEKQAFNTAIPDNNPAFTNAVIVSGSSGTIADLDVELLMSHTWQGDIIATLTHVDSGTSSILIDRPGVPETAAGFSADNFGNPVTGVKFVLDDEAAAVYDVSGGVVAPGIASVTGNWKPSPGLLSAFDGENFSGSWQLSISDNAAGDTGTLIQWGLIAAIPTEDCNENGLVDSCEIALNAAIDCDTNGIIDSCESGAGDCNTNGITDLCDTGFADCNENGVYDVCDIGAGTSSDCGPNGVPDECDPDCNANGVPDDCDINGGTSGDCNSNIVPDECENDCNLNGIADECDIAGGASDCNLDGILDECQLNPNKEYEGGSLTINDNVSDSDTITVADTGTVLDVDVCVNIQHTFDADLDITLSHNGVTIDLSSDNGGSGDNFTDTIFDDEAAASVVGSLAPFTGSFRPEQALSAYDGQSKLGDWTLTIGDDATGDTGTLLNWSLKLTNDALDDCDENGIPDVCQIDGNPSTDCNTNGILDACEPGADDCNTNGIADLCDAGFTDCNENGVYDICDVFAGTSDDCDGNNVPDECQDDCNGNGVADPCDIANGSSDDCNTNDVPDDCEIGISTTLTSTPGLAITDAATITDTIVVAGAGEINDVNVTLNIQHTFDGDIEASLSHDGTTVDLTSDNGGGGDNFTNTVFDDAAATSVTAGVSPFTGSFIPEVPLASFNGGDALGGWTLTIFDDAGGDTGTLLSWALTIDAQADCNNNGVPDDCDVLAGATDCNTNLIPDECEQGGAGDCNTNGIPDACDTFDDCNTNMLPDECDIDSGDSNDCDTNGIPDECELIDCDGNGIQDTCDLLSDPDCNTNGVIDSCDLVGLTVYSIAPNAAINDVVTLNSVINVPDLGTVSDVDVTLNIRHTWDSDLDITLNHGATTIDVSSDNGGSGDNYTNTVFDDEAAVTIVGAIAPMTGSFQPEQALSAFDGQDRSGDWTLSIFDDATGDTGTLLSWSLTIEAANDCNTNGIPDDCDVAAGETDCNTNNVPDICEQGGAGDCNTNGVPDTCDDFVDCNNNGTLDECDIASGSSDDCDLNGTPDECELVDCNTNGALDACDILGGGSDDCNTNLVPDECEIGEPFKELSSSPNSAITDALSTVDVINVVAGGPIADLDVCVNIQHTFDADLDITLSHNGVTIDLSSDNGGAGDNFTDTIFDDEAAATIVGALAPMTGSFQPEQALSAFDGMDKVGTWTLNVFDDAGGDTGTLLNWSLKITNNLEDCNTNGLIDSCESDGNPVVDCNANGIPDVCEVGNGDCNTNGIPDLCDAGFADCNANGIADECDIAAGTSGDCGPNGIPDECDADCNLNGVPDDCDIAGGTSDDCDGNVIPDECEFADCNNNGIHDPCDISGPTSEDCNTNGIPDECDVADGNFALSFPFSPGLAIPDGGGAANFLVVQIVLGGSQTITDVDTCVDITHTWDSDITVLLDHDGAFANVTIQNGGSGDNYTNTCFDDEAATPIGLGAPPFTGSFIPDQPLSALDGDPVGGVWTLAIADFVLADPGFLNRWDLFIQATPNSADANNNGIPDECEAGGCATCAGDVNGDGLVDGDDIQCFVECLISGSTATCTTCDCADMDGMNGVDAADLPLFVNVLLNGPNVCP